MRSMACLRSVLGWVTVFGVLDWVTANCWSDFDEWAEQSPKIQTEATGFKTGRANGSIMDGG